MTRGTPPPGASPELIPGGVRKEAGPGPVATSAPRWAVIAVAIVQVAGPSSSASTSATAPVCRRTPDRVATVVEGSSAAYSHLYRSRWSASTATAAAPIGNGATASGHAAWLASSQLDHTAVAMVPRIRILRAGTTEDPLCA